LVTEDPVCISIFSCVRKLREQRMIMVKQEEQYNFLYHFMGIWADKNPDMFA